MEKINWEKAKKGVCNFVMKANNEEDFEKRLKKLALVIT